MADQSHLDAKYFIDAYKYNCPFCNRRHVAYHVQGWQTEFNWSNSKKCYVYFVQCDSCAHKSMHLSHVPISLANAYSGAYRFEVAEGTDLDAFFFYSVPTSFFVLDDRIPAVIRELITEAESCRKLNLLTGASA